MVCDDDVICGRFRVLRPYEVTGVDVIFLAGFWLKFENPFPGNWLIWNHRRHRASNFFLWLILLQNFISDFFFFLFVWFPLWKISNLLENDSFAYHISTQSITYGRRIDLEIIHEALRPILGARATGYHQISILICMNLHKFGYET